MTATGATQRATAFAIADSTRSVEKGLAGFFQMANGVRLFTLGLSVALGRTYSRWLGWAGAAAGVGFVVGGTITANTGFSPEASAVLLAPLVLFVIFVLGTCAAMWHRTPTT